MLTDGEDRLPEMTAPTGQQQDSPVWQIYCLTVCGLPQQVSGTRAGWTVIGLSYSKFDYPEARRRY